MAIQPPDNLRQNLLIAFRFAIAAMLSTMTSHNDKILHLINKPHFSTTHSLMP